jgi:hypothetical protein
MGRARDDAPRGRRLPAGRAPDHAAHDRVPELSGRGGGHALRRGGDWLQPGRLGAPPGGGLRPPARGVGRREHGRHPLPGRARRASRVRLHLGHRALRLGLFHTAESASVPRVLGRMHQPGRCADGGDRGPVVESRAARQRDLHAGHPAQGPPPAPGDRTRHLSPRVRLARVPDRGIARVLLRRDRSPQGVRWSRALHLRRQGLPDSADHHPPTSAAQGRSHHAHQGGVHPRPRRGWPPRTGSDRCSSPARASTR